MSRLSQRKELPRTGSTEPPTQRAIQRWFDRTYGTKGVTYLRSDEFYSIFMEYLDVQPGERVLDIGCGPGLLLGRAVERGAGAWGIDVSATALALARRRVPRARVHTCNAEELCFGDHSFDHITCIGTFEHFLSGDRALEEMRRVLKPSGRICVMVPNSLTVKWQLEANFFGVHDNDSHERAATLSEWRAVFVRNRFEIDRIERDEWPGYQRRLRFGRLLGGGRDGFVTSCRRSRHLAPLRFANQFVFFLRP